MGLAGVFEGVEGLKGSGKTLYLSWRGWVLLCRMLFGNILPFLPEYIEMVEAKLRELGKFYNIYANFTLNYPYHRVTDENVFDIIEEFGPGLLLVTEAHRWFDSRQFSRNIDITQDFAEMRKLGVDLKFDTQHIDQIDKRIRNESHYITRAIAWPRPPVDSDPKYEPRRIYYETYRPIDISSDGMTQGEPVRVLVLSGDALRAKYALYNTYERIGV